VYLLRSLRTKYNAPANPWGANTLEWRTPSPPDYYNFHNTPRVSEGPYEYGNWVYDSASGGYQLRTAPDSSN
jgi:cytochrome c oxidase subunit I